MRVLGVPLPFYKSPTLLLGWGVSPFVFWQLLKARPDVIHAAFPGACASCAARRRLGSRTPGAFLGHVHQCHSIAETASKCIA